MKTKMGIIKKITGNLIGWRQFYAYGEKLYKDVIVLDNKEVIEIPDERRTQDKGKLQIRGGNVFNIKSMDVDVPLGRFVCITGVSGSGKSSFVYEIVHKNLQARFYIFIPINICSNPDNKSHIAIA